MPKAKIGKRGPTIKISSKSAAKIKASRRGKR